MNRLQAELRRLFQADPAAIAIPADQVPQPSSTLCRAFALQLSRPADWAALSAAWKAVQTELDLPAPAIAVNGRDGLQLWFSLAQAVEVRVALAFLDGLTGRYLAAWPGHRVAHLTDAWSPDHRPVPARVDASANRPDDEGAEEHWSAFVAPDLAAVFADTPWLEMSPSEDGQADLLSRLQCIRPEAWDLALARLGVGPMSPSRGPAASTGETAGPETAGPADRPDVWPVEAPRTVAPAATFDGPAGGPATVDLLDNELRTQARRFLLSVMNDSSAPLAQRVEAAKALLGSAGRQPGL